MAHVAAYRQTDGEVPSGACEGVYELTNVKLRDRGAVTKRQATEEARVLRAAFYPTLATEG